MTDAPFAGLLESAPDAMIVVGQDGNIVMVNGHAEALFGHDRAEIGAPVEILIPGADAASAGLTWLSRPSPSIRLSR